MLKIKSFIIFSLIVVLTSSKLLGQVNNESTDNRIIGRWTQCLDLKLDSLIVCDNRSITFSFESDNTFFEYQDFPEYNLSFELPGHWSLINNQLLLKRDDSIETKYSPSKHTIIWINKNLFYTTGKEKKNGPLVFTYYQRLK
jgi:hypothetical protein